MKSSSPLKAKRLAAAGALLALLLPLGAPRARSAQTPEDATAFLARVARTWAARDLQGWLSLWEFPSATAREQEEEDARVAFDGDETSLTFVRPPVPSADGSQVSADAQVVVVDEPRGRVAYWRLGAERRQERWVLVQRKLASQVDGLVHLSLAPQAWRVRDLRLRFEDLELALEQGTLFSTYEAVGRTALVFVGRARARFTPKPAAEREQLRQFSGAPALDAPLAWVYVRIHPGDFERLVGGTQLEAETPSPQARQEAERIFRARAPRSYMLETPLERSPWWLLPSPDDAVIDFPWRRGRVLTYALASGEAENVNLFDRDRRLQICSYSSPGHERGDEDARRELDVLDHELDVRFEPDRKEITAVHAMKLRVLSGTPTVRLRLDDSLHVSSLTTQDGSSLLFFRIREQSTLVVSLGTLGDRSAPITLVTRYAGRHDPARVDQEVLQAIPRSMDSEVDAEAAFIDDPPLVYSNRTAWYPRAPSEDYATATLRFDTPEGWLAVTGGEQRSLQSEGHRVRSEFRLEQPGKFITAVVGRLSDVGMRQLDKQSVRAYGTSRSRSGAVEQSATAEEMIAFFAEMFGPCPYPSLGLVLAEATTPGGHSPPGLVYLQERPLVLRRQLADDPANFSDMPGFFLAHELSHQWWGQGTAPASYRDRWLSEAWAQYSAALWVRHRLGEAAFRRMMDRMADWAFRHDAQGPIDLGQRLGNLRQDPRVFRAIVYDKGAWVIHMLRGIVGDEAFFRGSRQFLERHRYAKADADDLRQALEQASGRDLSPYFARWVDDVGLPSLRWQARTQGANGAFRTQVSVSAHGLPGTVPLEITLEGDGASEAKRVLLEANGGSYSFETPWPPRRVSLNEDRGLLCRVERGGSLPRP